MTLKEQLKEDLKSSLKSGNSQLRMLIGMVNSTIKNRELDKRSKLSKSGASPADADAQSQLNEEEIIEVIGSEIKKRKESVLQFESGGRTELAEGEKKEIELLMKYMPLQLGEAEIRAHVKKSIEEMGATSLKDMGKLTGHVMAKVKGKADGQVVSALVKEELSAL